ncbi:MAG: hypothetical protein OEY01_04125 [Desulfobulbaceae bacterium]|nr:hypothetical protein [Desulfobulbaceae bacterium]HIJ78371.1 VCBS repeat-containing protein [Deltaproteobacteria bacterium]
MKIQQAATNLTSQHQLREEHIREESLHLWVGEQRPLFADEAMPPATPLDDSTLVELSAQAKARAQAIHRPPSATAEPVDEPAGKEDPKLRTMRLILEALTGKKIELARFSAHDPAQTPATLNRGNNGDENGPAGQGWGMEYDYFAGYHEEETMRFNATGVIRTADAREINFELELILAREFSESTSISLRAGDARLVDPLVINFDGKAIELTEMKFDFDLAANGHQEKIPFVGPGQGFLFLDRNNDGVVNNGLELFGPASGNGFNELRQLDEDGNGWLDENDPLFAKLQAWMKDKNGNDYFLNLATQKIGAILLAPAATPFAMKDGGNALVGQLRESSIFVKENGTVGAIHEIDLAV